jgi:hypothetical protein
LNKTWRLADKQAIIGQGIHEVDGVDLAWASRTNYRNGRQAGDELDKLERNGEQRSLSRWTAV